MNLRIVNRIVPSGLLLLIVLANANSQSTTFADEIDQDPGCEITAKVLEDVLFDTRKAGEQLFILSRTGIGEKAIGWQRLNKVENLLRRPSSKPNFVVAEARPVAKGKGVVEFWIGSRPRAIVRFKRNQQFCIDTPEHGGR